MEKPDDLGKSPEAVARRWKLELKLADKRESEWRKKATDIYKLYTPSAPANNSFNILWTNTETLRQSVYNSLPQPDARRRYQDEDELGKVVGEVLTRALEFAQDTYDFDAVLKGDVLSMLLAGRAVSRVRYMPDIRTVEGEGGELQEGEGYEEISWEQTVCERVQYDDFRILCAAKTWDEVTAIGFKHRFTREDCVEKFGKEIGNAISLDSADDEDVKKATDCEDLFKTAEVWEIWDKPKKEVIFVCKTYATPCKTQNDPMEFSGFFPIPRPLYAIENDQTLIPAALYTQYEQQAKELNKISLRINKLMEALKVRGIYDSTLGEIDRLTKAADNDMIPAQNVTALLERGGLDKAIWMMPIETAAMVIKELYIQRDACKQIIYEITGIADIMRSASDPNETFGAQKIKTQWGTQRLQRMQKEVQRYIRDLVRLKAEVISEKFQPETLEAMTLVKLPHQAELDAEKARLMQIGQQYQMQAQQAQAMGQQPPPPPPELEKLKQPMPISWEAVCEAMKSDATRTYRIDIETDSTLSATQDSDMTALKDVMTGLSQIMQGFGPAVQQGAMDIGMLKELMLVVTRRAKMGTAIEDVIAKMKQPNPPVDPEAAKLQAQQQIEQAKSQAAMQIEQMKAQLQDRQRQSELMAKQQSDQTEAKLSAQLEQHKQNAQAQQNQHQNDLEAARQVQKSLLDAKLEESQQAHESVLNQQKLDFEHWKTEFTESAKIVAAQIAAKTAMDQALLAASQAADQTVAETSEPDNMAPLIDMHGKTLEAINGVMQQLARPKKLVRDDSGKTIGIE